MSTLPGFPIGFVSSQTGLSPHVIRAWERRYKAVVPQRSTNGRRLYSQRDIDRLMLLKRATRQGHRISTVAGLTRADLAALIRPSAAAYGQGPHSGAHPVRCDPQELIDACMQAVAGLNSSALHHLLQQASIAFSRRDLLETIVRPLMEHVGRHWSQGTLRIVHAHAAAVTMHSFLTRMLNDPVESDDTQACLLMATPSGQRCCLGALAVCILAQEYGWRPVFLGANLPAEEITAACDVLEPQLLAVSITCRVNDRFMQEELIRMSDAVADRCPLVIGGRASETYRHTIADRSGAVWATTEAFTDLLQSSGL